MARAPHLRRLADDWPIIFAVGVAIWFVVASLGATGFSLTSNDSPSNTTDNVGISTNKTSVVTDDKPNKIAVVAGPLKIKVVSFQVNPSKKNPGTVNAEITLELRNTTKENVSFYPAQVRLQRVGNAAPTAPKESIVMGVSPNLPLTAPVSFQLSPDPSATYQLFYGGHVLYSGLPF